MANLEGSALKIMMLVPKAKVKTNHWICELSPKPLMKYKFSKISLTFLKFSRLSPTFQVSLTNYKIP